MVDDRFPKDWKKKKLSDVGFSYSGLKSKSKKDFDEDGNAQFVTYRNINRNYFVDKHDLASVQVEEDENQNHVLKGDVLFTGSSETPEEVAFSSVMKEEIKNLYLNSFSFGYRFNNPKEFLPEFYGYYFRGPNFRKNVFPLAQGSTRYNLSKNEVLKIDIPVPSFKEQQKIAAILSSVDETIKKTEKIIEQTILIKNRLANQLLTIGIHHSNYKMTPIGRIPETWDFVNLSQVLTVQGGYAFKSINAVDKGIKWLKIANVGIGETKWNDKSFLPENYEDKYKAFLLKENDIVMAMTRPILNNKIKISKLSIEDTPSLLNQRVCRFIIKNNFSEDFFYHLARSRKFVNEIKLKIAGTDPPNISSKQIESIIVPMPPLEDQVKIASILNEFENKISNENDTLLYLNSLKKGLMQQLLTGKVRVPLNENEEVPQ